MNVNLPSYTLNDGSTLPMIGFGTYHEEFGNNLLPIKAAIDCGYRFFDTASLYETEKYLGQAIQESGIPREEFIIETKLWIDEADDARAALERSLKRLQMDYVDLYLIHWPRATEDNTDPWKEKNQKTWAQMEDLVKEGSTYYLL